MRKKDRSGKLYNAGCLLFAALFVIGSLVWCHSFEQEEAARKERLDKAIKELNKNKSQYSRYGDQPGQTPIGPPTPAQKAYFEQQKREAAQRAEEWRKKHPAPKAANKAKSSSAYERGLEEGYDDGYLDGFEDSYHSNYLDGKEHRESHDAYMEGYDEGYEGGYADGQSARDD